MRGWGARARAFGGAGAIGVAGSTAVTGMACGARTELDDSLARNTDGSSGHPESGARPSGSPSSVGSSSGSPSSVGSSSGSPSLGEGQSGAQSGSANDPGCVPAPAGLVSWWRGDGDSTDSVGPNHGILVGPVTFVPGAVGEAFAFARESYVSAPTFGLPTLGADRSIELWVKADAFPTTESFFAGYGGFGQFSQVYALGAGDPGHEVFFSQWRDAAHAQDIPLGTWFHVAVTTRGDLVRLYFNGALVATSNEPIATPNGTRFTMGSVTAPWGKVRQLVGEVDEVSVYSRVLAASEIAGIVAAGSAGKCR